MARSGKVMDAVIQEMQVPRSTVVRVDRHLGEMKLIRRQRGQHGPHYNAKELAYMIVGIMIMGGGLDITGASIPDILPRLSGLFRARISEDGQPFKPLPDDKVDRRAFIDVVADILDQLSDDIAALPTHRAIGITFAGDAVCGTVLRIVPARRKGHGAARILEYFGQYDNIAGIAFRRNVELWRPALEKLAKLLRQPSEENAQ